MTLFEYRIRMEAYRLKAIDKEYDLHKLAFLNFAVQSTKSSGKNSTKPVYDKFEKFFDYEKILNERRDKETSRDEKWKSLLDIARNLKAYRERRNING